MGFYLFQLVKLDLELRRKLREDFVALRRWSNIRCRNGRKKSAELVVQLDGKVERIFVRSKFCLIDRVLNRIQLAENRFRRGRNLGIAALPVFFEWVSRGTNVNYGLIGRRELVAYL